MTMTTCVMALMQVPTLPHPVHNSALRWEPYEKQHIIIPIYSLVCTWVGGEARDKHLCPSFAHVHSPATSFDLSLYRVGPGDTLI